MSKKATKRESLKPPILMMAMPVVLMILVLAVNVITGFVNRGSGGIDIDCIDTRSHIEQVVSPGDNCGVVYDVWISPIVMLSWYVGAFVAFAGTPFFIVGLVMLITRIRHNNRLQPNPKKRKSL